MNKKFIIRIFVLAAILAGAGFLSRLGLVGNCDTQLGLNIFNILPNGMRVWQESNSGAELSFPSLASMIFQGLFNLFGFSFSDAGMIFMALLAIVFVTAKLVLYLLDIKNDKTSLVVVSIIAIYSITNEYIILGLVTNSTVIWSFLALILSIYLFFRFHFEGKFVHLFLMTLSVTGMSVDIHMVLLAMSFFFSYLAIEFIYDLIGEKKINMHLLKESVAISALFLLLNSYWIIVNLKNVIFVNNSFLSSYLQSSSNTDGVKDAAASIVSPAYNFILSLIKDPNSGFLKFDILGTFIIVIILISGFIFITKEKKERTKKIWLILFIQYVFFTSLTLGPKNPLGIFDFFWHYLPAFKVFREFTKFYRLAVPIFIVLVSYPALKLIFVNKLLRRSLPVILSLIIVIKFVPYFDNLKQYLPYKVPGYYYDFYQFTKEDNLQSKIQLLPVISWYQGYEWSNQDYDMQEPIGYFTAKPVFFNSATYEENTEEKINDQIMMSVEQNNPEQLFGYASFRNIRRIAIRDDLSKSSAEKFKVDAEKIISSANNYEGLKLLRSIGNIQVYSINDKYFLPRVYIPEDIIVSRRSAEELPRMFSDKNYKISTAVFFADQNNDKQNFLDGLNDGRSNDNKSAIEFKEIDPTKYRIRFHHVSGKFPLVFSESFNDGWKLYRTKMNNPKSTLQNLDEYRILDGNEESQASKNELIDSIRKGWVSTLGDGEEKIINHKKWDGTWERDGYMEKYKIGFISKNYHGTIQNDNLPDGRIWETWGRESIDGNDNHLMVNNYANSWSINVDELCRNNNFCIKNADGTYDLEVVADYWPQRLFCLGLSISVLALVVSLCYLGHEEIGKFRKGRKAGAHNV